jgi:Tfp pilus assembly protein PilZ
MSPERTRTASGEFRIDRRLHPRLPVELKVVELDGTTTYFRYATNVSVGGLFLEGPSPYPTGTQVTLIFIPPKSTEPMRVDGEIVAGQAGESRGMHVKFLDDEDSDLRIKLRAFVRQGTQS